jgi:hypothetical protein
MVRYPRLHPDGEETMNILRFLDALIGLVLLFCIELAKLVSLSVKS